MEPSKTHEQRQQVELGEEQMDRLADRVAGKINTYSANADFFSSGSAPKTRPYNIFYQGLKEIAQARDEEERGEWREAAVSVSFLCPFSVQFRFSFFLCVCCFSWLDAVATGRGDWHGRRDGAGMPRGHAQVGHGLWQ